MTGLPTNVTSRISSGVRAALLRRLAQRDPVDRCAHRGGHLPLPARVHHHVRDPAHEVLAEPDLRVHRARRRHHLARGEVADMRRDRRRADVHGRQTVHPVLQARPHRDDVAIAVDRRGDAPVAGTQRGLEGLQHLEVAAQVRQIPLLAQRRLDPTQIAGGVVHVGPGNLHEPQPHHRVHTDRMHLGALAHHLPVHLTVGGNIDDDVATELRRAAQAASRSQRCPLLVVAPLDRPELGEVLRPVSSPRAWRTPRCSGPPGSGRRCPARRTPSRDRPRAPGRHRESTSRGGTVPAVRTG